MFMFRPPDRRFGRVLEGLPDAPTAGLMTINLDPTRSLEPRAKRLQGNPQPRVNPICGQVAEGFQHKSALMKPGVGDLEALFFQRRLAVEEQIKIQGTRTPTLAFLRPAPAALALDGQQALQQTARRQIGFHLKNCIEIWTLVAGTKRLGLINARRTNDSKPGGLPEHRPGVGEVGLALPQIGTQCDECANSSCGHNPISSLCRLGPGAAPAARLADAPMDHETPRKTRLLSAIELPRTPGFHDGLGSRASGRT